MFNGTFPNLHYFLVQEEEGTSEANLIFNQDVHRYFQTEVDPQLSTYSELFPVFEKSFGHILRPYYMEHMEWTHLKVGIVVEPNSIVLDKINLVLSSMYFVESEPFDMDDPEKYDVVVASTATFGRDYPEIPFFIWNIAEKDEDLPFLFYTLRDIFYEKSSKLRFM